eukprot:TRINITY_DN1894_c0_g1_i1.p1 TRINITY_DN1894_c0_g1~~TRINITY_DN1894_c0_g1_i1.p1  ORF type:complete len:545 (+),score=123.34 TRINITY_DN1894_c0_g1_i1:3-1637(+)
MKGHIQIIAITVSLTVLLVISVVVLGLRREDQITLNAHVENWYDDVDYVVSEHGAVATSSSVCSKVGIDVLKKGGNAADSAVATALCLDVVNSFATTIGSGGGALIYKEKEGEASFIDFREVAPNFYHTGMFVGDQESMNDGIHSIAIPGEIRGLEHIFKEFGSGALTWHELVTPSINLANEQIVTPLLEERIMEILESNYTSLLEILAPNGVALKAGQKFKQPKLAETLRKIAVGGADAFYSGDLADSIIEELNELNANWTKEDLGSYTVLSKQPVTGNYRGIDYFTAPSPFSGLALVQLLDIMENFDLGGENTLGDVHKFIEASRFAFTNRMSLGDPDFVNILEVYNSMTNKTHAKELSERITEGTHPFDYYSDFTDLKNTVQDHGTSHFSVTDKDGMSISLTHTVNGAWGSHIVGSNTGILWNNQIADFSSPGSSNVYGLAPHEENFIEPGKRPLSSMVPSIFTKEGKTKLVIGASGGPRIISATAQVILNVVDYKMDIKRAIEAPRVHHQNLPEVLLIDKFTDESTTNARSWLCKRYLHP